MRLILFMLLALGLSVGGGATDGEAKSGHKKCRSHAAAGQSAACSRGERGWRLAGHKAGHGASDQDRARNAVKSGQALPLSTILGQVRRRYPGKLLDANLSRRGGSLIYAIKLRGGDNRITLLQVDARTGRVLSVRQGR